MAEAPKHDGRMKKRKERLKKIIKKIRDLKHSFEKAGLLPGAKVEIIDDILDDIEDDIDDADRKELREIRRELLQILIDMMSEVSKGK